MAKYKLYVHSWDVIGNLHHTGFTLLIETDNGSYTRTIDLSPKNGHIAFIHDNTGQGGNIAGGRVHLLSGSDALSDMLQQCLTEIINYGGYQDNIYFTFNYLFTGKIF